MTFFVLLRSLTAALFRKLGWLVLGLAVVGHALVAYAGLLAAGEKHLTDLCSTFIYFYVTTTATVGYGDLSPQSPGGRLFVAMWMMLGGIALLTAVIGKATTSIIEIWRSKMKGMRDFTGRTQHTVLIGWQGEDSEKVVDLLHQDEASNEDGIVLLDSGLAENPMPGKIDFVRGESLSSEATLIRAGVCGAERVLIRTASDDITLAVVLTINKLNPAGHVVAHFNSTETAALARVYAPKLECTSNMGNEMLVRSSQDPGSSQLISELLCVGEGATQFSMKMTGLISTTFGDLYVRMKRDFNATLIGYRPAGQAIVVNPENGLPVSSGELFYIANHRINEGDIA